MINNATFLLVINCSIGLSFAATFLALSWNSDLRLARWIAGGFVAASATVMVEALAFAIPSVRLISALSFGFLMLALTLMAAGLVRHYRPNAPIRWLAIFAIVAVVLNPLVVFDLPRGGLAQASAYQLPFAVVSVVAATTVFASSRRTVDVVLAVILALCALQFVAKAVLAPLLSDGHALGVRDYIFSAYAYYSQTLATILSILLGLALVGLVVTELVAESARRLQRDSLSGALTRSAFLDQAAAILRRALSPRSAGLIICDLDHFKSVNDRFGHAAGDEVIRTFGALMRNAAGTDGVCGRIGGEEFCMLLTNCSTAAVRTEVEALRNEMARASYPLIPVDIKVTASFGIAMTDGHELLSDAMRRADLALYAAKAAGRDGYSFATPVAHSEIKA
jgi:diguanylate cyclase (GGDEF)-like protein